MLALPEEKLVRMTEAIRRREEGRSIRSYGPYGFGRMHILDIRADGAGR